MKEVWTCQTCKKEYSDHIKAERCHPPTSRYKCELCDYSTIFLEDAGNHRFYHESEEKKKTSTA